MKTISTLTTLTLLIISTFSYAQTLQNFEGGLGSIYGNCWTYSSDINLTSVVDKGGPISGTESMITLPPVNDGAKDYIYTPFLDLRLGEVRVSFKYALNTKLAGSAFRYIKIGFMDRAGVMMLMDSIYMDKMANLNIKIYEKKFVLPNTDSRKLYIEFSGNTGDGNSRLIFDDLFTSANYFYGVSGCNRAPLATNDAYLGVLGTSTSGNLTLNDSDPDNEVPYASVVTTTTDGTLVVNEDGTFTFTPSASFIGGKMVTFTYRLNDNGYSPLLSNIATVTIDYSMAILACKLNNFDGKLANNNVALRWSVSNNQSLKQIVVEESVNGRDFNFYSAVSSTGKAGDQNYVFTGKAPISGNMMYRVKLIDANNQVTYSNVLSFQTAAAANSAIKFVANKNSEEVSVCFQSATDNVLNIRIVDIAGHVVSMNKQTVNKGTNMIDVSAQHGFSRGTVYFVSVHDGTQSHVTKFIKN